VDCPGTSRADRLLKLRGALDIGLGSVRCSTYALGGSPLGTPYVAELVSTTPAVCHLVRILLRRLAVDERPNGSKSRRAPPEPGAQDTAQGRSYGPCTNEGSTTPCTPGVNRRPDVRRGRFPHRAAGRTDGSPPALVLVVPRTSLRGTSKHEQVVSSSISFYLDAYLRSRNAPHYGTPQQGEPCNDGPPTRTKHRRADHQKHPERFSFPRQCRTTRPRPMPMPPCRRRSTLAGR
jgi:hypothetical protein